MLLLASIIRSPMCEREMMSCGQEGDQNTNTVLFLSGTRPQFILMNTEAQRNILSVLYCLCCLYFSTAAQI